MERCSNSSNAPQFGPEPSDYYDYGHSPGHQSHKVRAIRAGGDISYCCGSVVSEVCMCGSEHSNWNICGVGPDCGVIEPLILHPTIPKPHQ